MKKFLSLLLSVAIVLSMLCLPAVANDSTADITLTQADFASKSARALAVTKIQEKIDAAKTKADTDKAFVMPIIRLASDVTVTITADDKDSALFPMTFTGIFDGDGHTITVKYAEGVTALELSVNNHGFLFSKIGGYDKTFDGNRVLAAAEVKDLTIKDAKISSTGKDGAQHGFIASSTTGTVNFTNVHFTDANFTKTAATNRNVGGYIGVVSSSVNFVNCSFAGVINDTDTKMAGMTAGFFVGRMQGSGGTVSFNGCTVVADSSIYAYTSAGGFVGRNGNVTDKSTAKMTLKFTGDNVMLASVNATMQAGGAVGLVDSTRDKNNIVDISGNLIINGTIGSANTTYAGGVIGNISSQVADNTDAKRSNVRISNVVNCQSVTGKTAGGIIGYSTAKWIAFTISNCINLGDVSATGAGAAGGIFGQHGTGKGNTITIDGCVNAGNVSAAQARAAGIAAHLGNSNATYKDANDASKTLKSTITISDCINFGAIENKMTEEDLLEIQDSTSNPAALGQAYTISCMMSSGTSKMTNCVNFGSRQGWKKTVSNGTDENGKTTYTVTAAVRDTAAAMYTSNTVLTGCVDFADAENTTTSVALDSALLNVLSGAVVRFNKNDITDNGLRYYIQTNEALLDKLAKTYTISLGSNFALADTLGEATSFMGLTEKVSTAKEALADVTIKADGTYAAALTNFAESQYALEFVAGGFITLTVDEKTFTIYTLAGDARSMAYVANETLKNDTAGKYNDYKTILETFAAALPAEN